MAVGHTILGIICELLATGQPFRDLGAAYFDQRGVDHVKRRLTRCLEQLGCPVALHPQVA